MKFGEESPRVQLSKDGFTFDLDSHKARGMMVRSAKDPVQVPTEPVIVEIAKDNLCHLGLGENCFTLTNVYGITVDIPYGATVDDWRKAAQTLLKQAMETNDAQPD